MQTQPCTPEHKGLLSHVALPLLISLSNLSSYRAVTWEMSNIIWQRTVLPCKEGELEDGLKENKDGFKVRISGLHASHLVKLGKVLILST